MPNATFTEGILTDDLVEVADSVRGLFTDLGARPFRAFVVRRTWTGERPGEGTLHETETEIIPRPLVLTKGLRGELRPAGLEEEGDIVIAEVSLTWTEPELYSPDVASNQRHLIRLDDAHGQGGRSRWYVPAKPPTPIRGDTKRSDVLGWTMELRRVEAEAL